MHTLTLEIIQISVVELLVPNVEVEAMSVEMGVAERVEELVPVALETVELGVAVVHVSVEAIRTSKG